ncbi:hypothetical protein CTEN210_06229 [Chaetoceros tenuissimus]|uniref:MYND-type domain-containing protein n=1 Tax=Chaetoceros tenuissimus TaxID=426638 RepID=A0AAD3CQ09_9STRA|nr:hypothetical protein CTEN210_06229 [Chaetoceros tenuissimus]
MNTWNNFGGFLNPQKLPVLYAMYLGFIGNLKLSLKVLKTVLDTNDKAYDARFAQLEIWYSFETKSCQDIFQEAKFLQQKLHKHDKRQPVLHIIISMLIIEDPSLGTLGDYFKEIQAEEEFTSSKLFRRLYPSKFRNNHIEQCFVNTYFRERKFSDDKISLRGRIDKATGRTKDALMKELETKMNDLKMSKRNYCCLHCDSYDRKLMECSSCHLVSYCSKDCQVADWKNHRKACRHYTQSTNRNIYNDFKTLLEALEFDDNDL